MKVDAIKEKLEHDLEEAKQEEQQLNDRLEDKPEFGLGEGASLAYSWEMGLARKEEITGRIDSLKEALARIEQGTYGRCANCGQQIDPERLEILPTTTLCPACAAKQQ